MSGLSDYAENLVQNWRLNAGAVTRPAAWFVALHTAYPTDAGTAAEVSTVSSGYARQAVTFGAASGGAVANTGLVLFGPCTAVGGWGTITHVSYWDAVTGGNCLGQGALSTAMKAFTAVVSGNVFTSPAHGLSVNDRVVLDAIFGTLPTPYVEGTSYFVQSVGTSDTFTLSATVGGAVITTTAAGMGQFRKVGAQTINLNDSFQFLTGLLTDTAF